MTNPNHTAFPSTEYYNERPIGGSDGLTKREYFAAMAMQGILAAGNCSKELEIESVRRADALIEALSK